MINRLAILGVGLIGGSLARALRDAGHVREIVGYGRGLANLQRAVELGVVDRIETSLSAAVNGADMVVLATPVGTMPEILAAIAPYLGKDAVVTDVGSVKGSVVTAARRVLATRLADFVPGHPIAGTERSGVEASFASLFVGRRVVLTPLPENKTETILRVRAMWQAAGAELVEMSVEHPDYPDGIAWLSEFPNLIVARTFSKVYGLAGLRVGYSVSSAAIADLLNRVRPPFNVNSLAQVAALAALTDDAHLSKTIQTNRDGMRQLTDGFRQRGLAFIPSVGNFVCVEVGDAAQVNEALLRQGVIVRPIAGYGMPRHLRVTVGLPAENNRLLAALKTVLGR